MTLEGLLAEITDLGVELSIVGDRLEFRAPHGALSPPLRQRLAERKAEVMALLAAGGTQAIQPLARGQRALWFLWRLAPDSPAYNLMHAVRIPGALPLETLRAAFQALVDRHAILRTTYRAFDGIPVQHVGAAVAVEIDRVDARDWSDADRLAALDAAAREPFDLEREPVFRLRLYQRASTDQVLLIAIHHIAVDYRSLDFLLGELHRLLVPLKTTNGGAPLAPPDAGFADFVRWQTDLLAGPEAERQWQYWRGALDDPPPPLDLPTDRPRGPAQTFAGAELRFPLDPRVVAGVRRLAADADTTPFTTMLAAWMVLLSRLTDQEELLIGTPVSGRTAPELEQIVGYLVNTVVLRGDLSGNPSFRELLGRLRPVVVGALEHQDYPLSLLVDRLHPSRDGGRSPFYDVMFVWDRIAEPEGGWEMVASGQRAGAVDLLLTIYEGRESFEGVLQYNTDLFDAATVERMGAQFAGVVTAMVGAPDGTIGSVTVASGSEGLEGAPAAVYPRESTVLAWIEAQAARTPERVAVVDATREVRYGALVAEVARVAAGLRGLGVQRGTTVGICVARSIEMVVAVLAVWKAGGTYLPLDPTYPAERLAFMLGDAGAALVLTQAALRGVAEAAAPAGVRVVALEQAWPAAEAVPAGAAATPADLAYVIYTSGSTGQPKGVEIGHQALQNVVWAFKAWPGVQPDDTWLAVTSLSFDIAALELLVPLVVGARLAIAEAAATIDGHQLAAWMARTGATVMQATPATWELLLESGWSGAPALRVWCGGEALPRRLADRLLGRVAEVWNCYGPTETTIWSTVARVTAGADAVPIGRPIANTQVYVLGPRGERRPVGVPGELYVGGDGLARGYRGQPALTAAAFVAHPDRPAPARVYRTGDRVRQRADGTLEYLGRLDSQVKLRGVRIEPGEIEATLTRHPAVRQAVVLVREDTPGDRRLVGYLVLHGDSSIDEVRGWVASFLPPAMIPAALVALDSLPLTPNGKIDRRALPPPDLAQPTEEARVAPGTPTEVRLAAIVGEMLGVDGIAGNDNFFARGGSSLSAIRVCSRASSAFGVQVPVQALFERPMVAALAALVEELGRAQGAGHAPLPPILKIRRLPYPGSTIGEHYAEASFAQQRLWFLYKLQPESPAYNIAEIIEIDGPLDAPALSRSLNAIVERHETLRTRFAGGEGVVQIIAPALHVPLASGDLSVLEPDARQAVFDRQALEEARRPFDLERGPLIRATLVRLGDLEHRLLLTIHHVVADGWSLGVLVDELLDGYRRFQEGGTVPHGAPFSVQYADHAAWERQRVDETAAARLAYWRRTLVPPLAVLELPADRPRPRVFTYRGARFEGTLAPQLTAGLKALALRENATLFMVMLAAFQVLLHLLTDETDLLIGTPVANREHPDIAPLIGLFMNMIVIRVDVAGEPTFRELVRRTVAAATGAFAHQDFPFELLVEKLQPARDRSRSPLFQVAFTMEQPPLDVTPSSDLRWALLSSDPGTTKFDLTLTVVEASGGLSTRWEYNTDLYDAATVERMGAQFAGVVTAMVGAPDATIGSVTVASGSEGLEGAPAAVYPRESTVLAWIEAQAARTPERVAVVDATREVRYGALVAEVARVAAGLRGLGVQRGTTVGICVARSIEMVVAVLAVWKAGGTYLPLDPTYPAERLAFMLGDAGAALVLTQAALRGVAEAAAPAGVRVVALEQAWPAAEAVPAGAAATPADLAYVIYTSGSTGQPKGVEIGHQALQNVVWAFKAWPGVQPDDTWLAVTSLSFDIAALELLVPLVVGARLAIAEAAATIDGHQLAAWMARTGATVMQATPATWELLLESGWSGAPALRVWCGGEALPRRLADRLLGRVAEVWNCYGPTETTIWSTVARVTTGADAVPIGRPIANTQVYVLGPRGERRPVGVPGELYIGGDGLARGYRGQPGLTAAAFVAHPDRPAPARVYRTGDRVRQRADGTLEYLGRLDSQVKLRGVRIEPGEIEATLTRHPAVRQAVVLVREDTPGDRRLVAYFVASGVPPTTTDLRTFLRALLPPNMLPSVFVPIDVFPLTPNGKIDRRALPAPEAARAAIAAAPVPPRTALESQLAEIFARVLKVPTVGVLDNFFELGGASLQSVEVMAYAQDAGLPITLDLLFEHQTVAGLAAAIHEDVANRA